MKPLGLPSFKPFLVKETGSFLGTLKIRNSWEKGKAPQMKVTPISVGHCIIYVILKFSLDFSLKSWLKLADNKPSEEWICVTHFFTLCSAWTSCNYAVWIEKWLDFLPQVCWGETINNLILWFTVRFGRYEEILKCIRLSAKGMNRVYPCIWAACSCTYTRDYSPTIMYCWKLRAKTDGEAQTLI